MTGLQAQQSLPRRFRGRPLIMLGAVLLGWASLRAAYWEAPFARQFDAVVGPLLANVDLAPKATLVPENTGRQAPLFASRDAAVLFGPEHSSVGDFRSLNGGFVPVPMEQPYAPIDLSQGNAGNVRSAASHQIMWMAAMAHLPLPASIGSAAQDRSQAPTDQSTNGSRNFRLGLAGGNSKGSNQSIDRWSLDAWVFWRQNSGRRARPTRSSAASSNLPSYGASQAGAVLRYALSPASGHRPRAYVRAYASLRGNTEQELAAGLSARPMGAVPVRVHAEGRALQSGGRTSARAAAFVTSELPPVRLPAGLTGEIYGQAGYVTGTNATHFADGQVHVMRELARFDLAGTQNAKVNLGAAAFAGAQKGASRADIGPSLRLETSIANTPIRLSADWRERIAGDAEPGSGLAVTLSTRF